MIFKEISLKKVLLKKVVCVIYLIWLFLGLILGLGQPGFAQEFQETKNPIPIQVSELKAFIHKNEESANAGQIERMIENFAADAQITIYSLESEPVIFNRSEYYQNLATVFAHYRAYSNRMIIDRLKILDPQSAIVQGTTYEKINFSDRPFNGVSSWQAKIAKRDGKLLFTEVNAYLSRASLEQN